MDDVIIAGSLDKKELEKSINELVAMIDDKLGNAAVSFDAGISLMESSLKRFHDYSKNVSNDLRDSFKEMGMSFDAILKAQQNATSSGNNSGTGGGNSQYADNTVGHLQEIIALEEKRRKEMTLGSDALRDQNKLIEEQKAKLKGETTSDQVKAAQAAKKELQEAFTMPARGLADAEKKLQQLQSLSAKFQGKGILDQTQWNRLNAQIQTTQEKIDKLRNAKPKSLKEVLGMDASSLDAIQAKMKAIANFRLHVNADAHQKLIQRLNLEYDELHKKQLRLMGQNASLARSNNHLAQSFGYIRNRLVYAMTLGAITNFTKQVYEIRGQYELLERSLGVLVGSFERGSKIFQELNEMAIKSPFTLVELGTAAKQLTAYNFAAEEVVDTTRRLADISAALGVPMERLTYNLGQIKAQGVLNARDARDFANAGLAIVPMLAQMYTEQKRFGDQVVTTAQVYDMMSKKLVSYSDVLQVLYKITNEGGKFFDFQAKQAETLKVQMNNLTLAMNNMYNEMGASNQGLLVGSVQTLKRIFESWREIARAIETVIFALGTYKAISFIATSVVPWLSLAKSIHSAKDAMALFNLTIKANPLGLIASLLASVIGYFVLFKNTVNDASHDVELFGENGTKTLKKIDTFKKILEGTSETSSTYKKTLSELSSITDEYGVQLDKENAKRSDVNSAIEQTIELIKTESAERQRANQLAKAQETYDTQAENARKELRERLKTAMTGTNLGLFTWKSDSKELQENADAISEIVASIVESNITLIAGKTGEEYEKGLDKIFSLIQDRMKAIGISESTVSKQWLSSALFSETNIINEYIDKINDAKNAQDIHNEKIEKNYEVTKKSTQSTMSFTEKVDANARALRNNANDAVSLYNRVYEIVKLAQQNHVINFDLKLTAQKPPQWMLNMDLPELQRLAARFTAIAQSGGHAGGYTQETTYERGLMYASAARQKQYEEERKALEDRNKRNRSGGSRGSKNDNILDALKEEISLVKKLQSEYDKLTKSGVKSADAIAAMQDAYGSTLRLLNKDLQEFGLPHIELSNILGKNPHEILAVFTELRNILESKGLSNLERMKAVEGVIEELKVSAKTYDMKKVTDGLNSELEKIKEEYELAIELDANPELGGIFADMMGISKDELAELPRTYDQMISKLQGRIDKLFSDNNMSGVGFDLVEMLNQSKFEDWVKKQGNTLDDTFVKALNKIREYANKVRLDETKETTKSWSQLIDKYGQLQYKLVKIAKDATKEMKNIVNKFGNDEQKKLALDLANKISISQDPSEIARLQEQLRQLLNQVTQGNEQAVNINAAVQNQQNQQTSKAYWDDFKNSDYYTMMFEDMSRNSTRAIQLIIDKMNELKDKVKEDPASMKALSKSLQDAQKELESRSSTVTILDALKEMRTAYDEVTTARKNLANADKEVGDAEKALESSKGDADKTAAAVERLRIARERQKQATLDAANAETKYRAASKKLQGGMETLSSELQNVQSIFGAVAKLFAAAGDDETAEAINAISEGFSIMTTIIMGVVAAMVLLESTVPWLLAVAAALSVIVGLVSWLSGNDDKQIEKDIKKSEIAVKRLENSYKNLEKAVEEAYGASQIAARKAAVANKELQLVELQRQLQLEKSKSSKKRDAGRIADLEGQIIDLKNELKDMRNDITNSFLGISSVSDAVSSMMDDIVDALRNGEDAMQGFNDSIDDMIANMIKQVFSARILGPMIEKIWKNIDDEIQARGEVPADQLARFQSMYDHIVTNTGDTGNGYWFYRQGNTWGYTNSWWQAYQLQMQEGVEMMTYGAWKSAIENILSNTQEWLDDATTPTMNDIRRYAGDLREVSPELEAYMDDLEAILREMGLIKDATSEEALSKLQQGIQGVTEDTAGAIEAYMNIVAQRVFEQNLYLQEIRDHLNNFDLDVQLGTLSQMLLQLQQSYQVQQNIESILTGVLNPSGRAIVVELNS